MALRVAFVSSWNVHCITSLFLTSNFRRLLMILRSSQISEYYLTTRVSIKIQSSGLITLIFFILIGDSQGSMETDCVGLEKCLMPLNRYQCPKCSKDYKSGSILKRHLTYECGVAPRFSCRYCTYKAKRNYELRLHIRARHGIGCELEWNL